jgi:hypothetical protein
MYPEDATVVFMLGVPPAWATLTLPPVNPLGSPEVGEAIPEEKFQTI